MDRFSCLWKIVIGGSCIGCFDAEQSFALIQAIENQTHFKNKKDKKRSKGKLLEDLKELQNLEKKAQGDCQNAKDIGTNSTTSIKTRLVKISVDKDGKIITKKVQKYCKKESGQIIRESQEENEGEGTTFGNGGQPPEQIASLLGSKEHLESQLPQWPTKDETPSIQVNCHCPDEDLHQMGRLPRGAER